MALRKRWILIVAAILLIAIVLLSFYEGTQPKLTEDKDTQILYQLSAFNVFSAGNYDGNTSFADLAEHGDFGIGTLNGLNGEMIALNGKFYQIPVNGSPRQIESSEITPYATVTFFQENQAFEIANVSTYAQLTADINASLPDFNAIYAIKVHGYFESAQTRSVPIQSKPYPALTEAVKNQTVFNLNGVQGTAVGFFFPNSMNGVDYVGYHLHFLTDDYTAGGHLLDCNIKNGTAEIEQIKQYYLQIP